MSGRDTLEARHTAFIETVESQEFEFDIIDVIDSGDVVVEIAHISSTIHFRNGETHSNRIKHMVIWREQADGTLKIAAEAVNRDAP
jgi:ketosteroid isomerase-like protein